MNKKYLFILIIFILSAILSACYFYLGGPYLARIKKLDCSSYYTGYISTYDNIKTRQCLDPPHCGGPGYDRLDSMASVGMCLCDKYLVTKDSRYKEAVIELCQDYETCSLLANNTYEPLNSDYICENKESYFRKVQII